MFNKFILCCALVLGAFGFVIHADVIDPQGDENLGFLTLNFPEMPSGKKAEGAVQSISTKLLTNFKNGETLRLLAADYNLVLSDLITFPNTTHTFTVKAKQTTLADEFGAIKFVFSTIAQPDIEGDGLPTASLVNSTSQSTYLANYSSAYAPEYWIQSGDYEITWEKWGLLGYPAIPKTALTVKKGDSKIFNANIPDYSSELKLEAPKQVYQNSFASAEHCDKTYSFDTMILFRDLNMPLDQAVFTAKNSTALGSKTPLAKMDYSYRFYPRLNTAYLLAVNGVPYTFSYPTHSSSYTIPIRRIDVSDVKVTKEDGTTYLVTGSYSVWYKNAAGTYEKINAPYFDYSCYAKVQNIFATRTGLDVPPGEYKVKVSYNTLEGMKQTKDYDLDLR